MQLADQDYSIQYIEEDNQIIINGILRLESVSHYDTAMNPILEKAYRHKKPIILDISRLEMLNSSGVASLSLIIIEARKREHTLTIRASQHIYWQTKTMEDFKELNKKIQIEYITRH